MGIFSKEKTPEERERELEELGLENQILEQRSQVEEKRAVIAQLRKQYGRDWAKTLGISKLTDLHTLKSFLTDAKHGMTKASVPQKSMREFYWPNGTLPRRKF